MRHNDNPKLPHFEPHTVLDLRLIGDNGGSADMPAHDDEIARPESKRPNYFSHSVRRDVETALHLYGKDVTAPDPSDAELAMIEAIDGRNDENVEDEYYAPTDNDTDGELGEELEEEDIPPVSMVRETSGAEGVVPIPKRHHLSHRRRHTA